MQVGPVLIDKVLKQLPSRRCHMVYRVDLEILIRLVNLCGLTNLLSEVSRYKCKSLLDNSHMVLPRMVLLAEIKCF
jgi:hypothetical protein